MSTPSHNVVDYLEVPSRDISATKAFFSGLFGWSFEDYGPDYTCFDDGRVRGGFWKSAEVASVAKGSALVIFFHAELEQAREQVIGLGGAIVRDIFSFPGGRRFHFTEPGGSEFAIWSEK